MNALIKWILISIAVALSIGAIFLLFSPERIVADSSVSYPPPEAKSDTIESTAYPASIANPTSNDAFSLTIGGILVGVDPKNIASVSDVIVLAKVVSKDEPIWSTPDGLRPNNPFEGKFVIVTPYTLEAIESMKGKPSPLIIIYTAGGSVGQDSVKNDNQRSYSINQKVLLFLKQDAYNKVYWINDSYTLSKDGVANNDFQSYPYDKIKELIQNE